MTNIKLNLFFFTTLYIEQYIFRAKYAVEKRNFTLIVKASSRISNMVKFSIRNFLSGCFLFPYAILNTVCLRNANWIRESLEISTNRQFNFYVNVIFRIDAILTEDYCSILSTRINANQNFLFFSLIFSFLLFYFYSFFD